MSLISWEDATYPDNIPRQPTTTTSERHAFNLALYFERLPKRYTNPETLSTLAKLEAKHLQKTLTLEEYEWLKQLYIKSCALNGAPKRVARWAALKNGFRG